MALPFLRNGTRKKQDQVLAVDLGGRVTKAVHLQRRNDDFALYRYALLDAPIFDKNVTADMLKEHLLAIGKSFESSKIKNVVLTVGVNDAVVRHVEMPVMPTEDVRAVLKLNSRVYLQQDLSNYVFDCHTPRQQQQGKPAEPAGKAAAVPKQKLLIAGAKKQLVDDFLIFAK